MGLRDLLRRLTRSGRREEKEPDTREGASLHDSRDMWEQQAFGVTPPRPTGQDKPKY